MEEYKLPKGYEAITCPKCENFWVTASKKQWVTCPNCQRKFDRKKAKENLVKKLKNSNSDLKIIEDNIKPPLKIKGD